ncbi:MAG TPA: SGNH/GDSL hydrolase family protein, partial [Puia sp.]|nr:SGNH/GDSL hydrolase family protein [Puia sp.]
MYRRVIFFTTLFLVFQSAFSQSRKYVIAVIGSSTAQGVGADPIDSSWVNRTKSYYQSLGLIDTIYNIALGGQTTYGGMPSGFTPPAGRPAPDPATNVTKALSFHPDVVLVNFPSNDAAADYSLTETMSNLRAIYGAVVAAGKIAFITTSEPRTSLETSQKELLKTMRDSVEAEFGANSLDFYDAIVGPDSLDINPAYNFDGTHVNNAGHRQLFEVVRNAHILSGLAPAAPTLLGFTAKPEGNIVRLDWALTGASGPVTVLVQRSIDSTNFADIGR